MQLKDYTAAVRDAIAEMTAALDNGTANHVVVDLRYLCGSDGSQIFPIITALEGDQRVNRPGDLMALTSGENEQAATLIASRFDLDSEVSFVDEMAPARADNFLCLCTDIDLPQSGFICSVLTTRSGNEDLPMAIEPDVPIALSSVDFFAGGSVGKMA